MIEILKNKDALLKLKAEWNCLARDFGTPLLSHEWFVSCAEAFYEDGDLRVVILRNKGKISAIAPLALVRQNGFDRLELLGVSILQEPSGLLYDAEDSLQVLLEAVVHLGKPIILLRVPHDSPVTTVLQRVTKFRGVFKKLITAGSAYIPIESDWDKYYHTITSRRRYDFMRAQRRAEENGEVRISIFSPTKMELDDCLKTALHIEKSGWKGRRGSALLFKKNLQHFFRTYCVYASQEGILRFAFLEIEGHVVAMQIAVEYNKRFWVLKIGYDETWTRCSPGIQLMMGTIRYAFDKGLKGYEFLGSDEPWLKMWPHSTHTYSTVLVHPISLDGIIGLIWDTSQFVKKRITKFKVL